MSTIRRLYFYALSLISIEVVIWGVINLLRTMLSDRMVGGGSLLATGLSLVLVGMPIFFLHWRTVQRDAAREPEEHASRIRAVFLYAAQFATLSPIVYAVLAVINRALVALFGQPSYAAWFGGDGTAVDNLIAILINSIAFGYFWTVLRADWQSGIPDRFLRETRRLYRYIWVVVGLTFTVAGASNLLRFLFYLPGSPDSTSTLAGGIALLLVGVPLWWFFWQWVQVSQVDAEERHSLLRLVVLYLISLAGVIGLLITASAVLNNLIRWILGEPWTVSEFFQVNSMQLGIAISLAVMWSYYGRILTREVSSLTDQPRRAALRRLYNYILSLFGLAVTFAGLVSLATFLARLLFDQNALIVVRNLLSGPLSALLVGLPLWLMTWPEMQREAARKDDVGDHARRSVLRKTYLYLVLFLLMIGAMVVAGQILYALLDAVLDQAPDDFARQLLEMILWLVIDAALLVYHWRALREDNRTAQRTLGDLHAAFPTLILAEEGESSEFAEATVDALQRIAPRLPVAVNRIERGAPDESMLGAKAVLLPFVMAVEPPEALRLWLNEYQGRRILIPEEREGWLWLGQLDRNTSERAKEAAQTLRQLAEGEAVRRSMPSSPWAIAGYILGGISGLILLAILFSILLSSLFG